MIAAVVRAALVQRVAVFLLAGALLAAGLSAARRAALDVFPEFAPPIVEIQTEAAGYSASDVEAVVTTPLERALGGMPDIEKLRSSSALGLSTITAVFAYGTDAYRARQLVIERVALAATTLPPGIAPAVSPLASVLTTILAVGLRGAPGISPLALRDFAEWTMRPRLLAVPGVANVVVYGGGIRQVQVTTTPERLRAANATLDELAAAITAADAASGSGYLDRSGQRLITWFDGRLRDPADIGRAPLPGRDGTPMPVAAVADVTEGPAVAVGDAIVNGEPGVLLLITKQPEVNVVAVTRDAEEALDGLARVLPPGVTLDRSLFRQATFVEHAIGNLRRALVAGAVLVMIVLLLFLGHVRIALASVIAIPLSLLSAIVVLHAFGATLNVMALGGLAIAVGEVVDDAIIDVENAWRRLRAAPAGAPALEIVLAASVEVRSAVVYATLMVALVFLPVFLLGGLEGALFRPLATAYVLATLSSLLVALTVTPALALVLLPAVVARQPRPPRLVTALRTRYERALARTLVRPAPAVAVSIVAMLAGLGLAFFLRLAFLPEFHETNFIMHMTGAPGVGLDETVRVGRFAAHEFLTVPGVKSVAQFIGRATLSEDASFGSERGELMVRLAPDADAVAVTDALRERAAAIAGFAFDIKQFLNERIEETLEGAGADLVVHVHGADLDALEQAALALTQRLSAIPGAVDVHAPGALVAPAITIHPRRDDLLRLGVPTASVERALRSVLGGVPAGRIVAGERQMEVSLRVDRGASGDAGGLARLPIATARGEIVALGSVADLDPGTLRASIAHEDGARTLAVRIDVRGRALEAVAGDVAATVAATPLPPGVYAEVGGEYAAARAARGRLLSLGALALAGIFVLLTIDFGSPRLAALIMVNVPLALVGGVVAVLVGAAGTLSLGAIVGFVTVFGITIRNGIVLVAHFRQSEREHGRELDADELVAAAGDRLAPIVMTALVTGIALVPLLALGGHAGGEIEHPMALVIVGGLVTSTWLNLFLVPLAYGRATRARVRVSRPRA